jgi:integrative and conjugative element protein (TIGR02256 family)
VPSVKTWIPMTAVERLANAAAAEYPLETGGLIIGYWANSREAVITGVSLSGPKARHSRYSYRPDYEHDIEVIRNVYDASAGVQTYLGDWHTHPNTTRSYLSFKDRRALHRIANSPEARAPRPLGMVCAGSGAEWRPKVWVGEEAWTAFGWRFLVTIATTLVEY